MGELWLINDENHAPIHVLISAVNPSHAQIWLVLPPVKGDAAPAFTVNIPECGSETDDSGVPGTMPYTVWPEAEIPLPYRALTERLCTLLTPDLMFAIGFTPDQAGQRVTWCPVSESTSAELRIDQVCRLACRIADQHWTSDDRVNHHISIKPPIEE